MSKYLTKPDSFLRNEVSFADIESHSDTFTQWNYVCPPLLNTSTGYEDLESELRKYTNVDFFNADEEGRNRIIQEVCDIYERRGIYPIRYFSEKGMYSEILKCMNFEAKFDGDTVSTGLNVGTTLCSWFFPNLFKTPSIRDMTPDKAGGETAWDKFYNRKFLERVISFCYNYNYTESSGTVGYPGLNPMSGIRMIGSVPTNFRPMNAKAIYERFVKPGGVIWDPSVGFGGRILGALSSSNEYHYIGTDPNTESIYNAHRLGTAIEKVSGRKDSFELYCCGSEDLRLDEKSVDFVFTSPPYFDLEQYGSDGGDFNSANQSYKRFPELEAWMEGYVRGTIQNIRHCLKKRSYCAINIADFEGRGGKVSYVDWWRTISEEEGLQYYDTVYLGIRARSGSKLLGDEDGSLKQENILIFKKR